MHTDHESRQAPRLPVSTARPTPAGTLSEAEIRQIVRDVLG